MDSKFIELTSNETHLPICLNINNIGMVRKPGAEASYSRVHIIGDTHFTEVEESYEDIMSKLNPAKINYEQNLSDAISRKMSGLYT